MTGAQKNYLRSHGIDPWSLKWGDARDLGAPDWYTTEAAKLDDSRILLANGKVRVVREAT